MENNHPVLQQLKDRIAELEKEIEQRKEQSRQRAYEIVANEEKLKEVLVEGINDSEITNEFAKSIADIFDIELTAQIDVEFVFRVQASFNVPIGFDPDDLANDVGIETNFIGNAEEYLNHDYWELDDWNITS
jgi:sugar-specific transcriptional regulator TrmB